MSTLQQFGILIALTTLPAMARSFLGSAVTDAHWSGYIASGAAGSVTHVEASWVVPTVICDGQNSSRVYHWVGLDGWSSISPQTLERIGTRATCVAGTTVPSYSAWYEFAPTQQAPAGIPSIAVAAGDTIFANVNYSGGVVNVAITDKHPGQPLQSFSANQPPGFPPPGLASAEWIAEMPPFGQSSPVPLADFGSVSYMDCRTTVSGHLQGLGQFPSANVLKVIMVNQYSKAVPSRLLSVSSFSITSCTPPPVGLMGWWPADGNYNDIIGGDNGAPAGGASFTSGMVGQAFSFGGGGYVEVPSTPALEPAQVSVAAWVKASNVGTYRYILDKGNTPCDASYALYTGATGGLIFYICNGTPGGDIFSPDAGTAVWNGSFHLVVGTFDGATVRLYVDGVQVGNGNPTNESISYDSAEPDLFIGTYNGDTSGFFNWQGAVDEVQVFNRALSGTEIQSIFQAGRAGVCHLGK